MRLRKINSWIALAASISGILGFAGYVFDKFRPPIVAANEINVNSVEVEAHPTLLAHDGFISGEMFRASASILNSTYGEINLNKIEADLLDDRLSLIDSAATKIDGGKLLKVAAQRNIIITANIVSRPCMVRLKVYFSDNTQSEKLFAVSSLSDGRFLLIDASPVTAEIPASAKAQCR